MFAVSNDYLWAAVCFTVAILAALGAVLVGRKK
jgi:hypothetical protein